MQAIPERRTISGMSTLPHRAPPTLERPLAPPPLPPGLAEVTDIRQFLADRPEVVASSEEERLEQLRRVAHRVAYRLVGDDGIAQRSADAALQRGRSPRRKRSVLGMDEASVTRATVEHILSRGTLPATGCSFASQRTRLRRELRRWGDRERTILAMVHLADLDPTRVARLLDCDEVIVRTVAGAWIPATAPGADLTHLDPSG